MEGAWGWVGLFHVKHLAYSMQESAYTMHSFAHYKRSDCVVVVVLQQVMQFGTPVAVQHCSSLTIQSFIMEGAW